MKKLLGIFIVLIAISSMVFAAGGKEETTEGAGPVVINYYEWDMPNEQFIRDFEVENPGIKVEVHIIPANGERTTKLDTLAISGSDMDVFPIADGDQFLRMENGMLANLDPYIAADGFDMKKSFGDFAEWGVGSDGHVYGIPYRMTKTVVFYNKDYFDAAGVPYPSDDWTLDEYIETARKMAEWGKDKGIYGTYTHTYNNEWATIAGQKGQWYTKDGKCNIKDPAWVTGLSTRKRLDDEGTQMSFTEIKAVKATINASFLGGKEAMVTAGSWLVRDMKKKDKFPHDFKIGIAYMPRFDESVTGKRSNFSVSVLTVPENSKHKEEAWKFIKYYVQRASGAIAETGNMPTYLPAYTDEVTEIFRNGSGLDKADCDKLFAQDIQFTTNKILGGDGAKYMTIIGQESTLYFNGEKSLEATLNTIETRVNSEVLGK